jgi:FtsP/CotA-like multicopper oxidase with cupredoxin domain
MASEFRPHEADGADEPMLGVGPSSPSHAEKTTTAAGRAGASRRRGALTKAIFALCCLSLLALPVFFFVQISHQQKNSSPSSDHDEAHSGDGELASPVAIIPTPLSTPSAAAAAGDQDDDQQKALSLADQLDLKTGFVVSSKTQTRNYVFNITRDTAAPDGVSKSMVLVNGQSPGPLIEANTGDRIRVVVNNQMSHEGTSIHWHGIDQRNSAWMDGVQGVSQCAIPPGESFTYEFDLPDQRGTFWYHAHVRVQYTDGLYGPLIIHDPEEKVPKVDDDKILMIGELYHQTGDKLLNDFMSHSPPWSPQMPGMEPPPDNIVMNGQSLFNCSALSRRDTPSPQSGGGMMEHGDQQVHGVPSNSGMMEHGDQHGHGSGMSVASGSQDAAPPECNGGSRYKTRVKSGHNVRIRLISHSTSTPTWFTIDSHVLSIIEVDGVEIEPILTSRVFMYPGQRYSVVVHANQTSGNYLMRTAAAVNCFHMPRHGPTPGLTIVGNEATGVLSYDEIEDDATPIGTAWDIKSFSSPGVGPEPWKGSCHDLPFGLAKPMRAMEAYEVGDRNYHYFSYRRSGPSTIINDTVYAASEDDALLWKALDPAVVNGSQSLGSTRIGGKPKQQVLLSLDHEKGAQIVINADNMMSHPWHLHGQNFQVVGWGNGNFGASKTKWKLNNPMRRDTITVPGNGHVVLRIRADNPGIWALHCHILWHAEGGMFVTVAQQLDKLREMLARMAGSDPALDMRHRFCAAKPSLPSA